MRYEPFLFWKLLSGALLLTGGLVACSSAERHPAADGTTPAAASATVVPAPLALRPLPLGAITPTGWLRRQLEIQAAGLSGHLDEFWPDLDATSAWRGGVGEGWERGPYYLDGLVPLAYGLRDARLIAKIRPWIEWTLTHQRPDGNIGPAKNTDWWPNMIMLKVLTQYQEATGDPRVVPFLQKYFAYQAARQQANPFREWAKYRWAEELLTIRWLYDRAPAPALLALARQLHDQGYDWRQQFENFTFTEKTSRAQLGLVNGVNNTDRALQAHGVNNAMALKMPTLWGSFSGDTADQRAIFRQLAVLDRYHLLPIGMHSGDEHYAGPDPSQGVELCAVVEAMFSYEQLLALRGDAAFGDRLERIAYNALPATFDETMWAHQYDQQPNQVLCSKQPRAWSTNDDESNLFGLEPHYGCCTANMHQGWPKLTSHLWMGTGSGDGLAAVVYAPSRVTTTVAGGVALAVAEDTDYPFRETVRLTLTPARAASFPLQLRIPAWATQATVAVNGQPQPGVQPGTFFTLTRTWQPGDQVLLTLPMAVRTDRWHRGAATVERGPLLFALPVAATWQKIKDRPTRADDYEVRPAGAWNYGLQLPAAAGPAPGLLARERPLGRSAFSASAPPVTVQVLGRRVPAWQLVQHSAGPLPASPARSTPKAPPQTLTLIPYGAAKLRVSTFPVVLP